MVLEHTLGHLPAGVKACNYLFERVPGFPASTRLGAPHRGQPTSCARVRGRVPEVAGRVPCDCVFEQRPGQYAHPMRYAEGQDAAPARSLDELLSAYGRAMDRLRVLEDEARGLRIAALQGLIRVPGGRWAVPGGEWRAEGELDLAVLVFHPSEAEL